MRKEKYENTEFPGIKKLIGKSGYVAVLDYGRQPRLDKETGESIMKQVKTQRKFATLKEAKKAKREADDARSIGINTSGIKKQEIQRRCNRFPKQ